MKYFYTLSGALNAIKNSLLVIMLCFGFVLNAQLPSTTITVERCVSYVTSFGDTITATSIVRDTLTNSLGFDSLEVITDVTINPFFDPILTVDPAQCAPNPSFNFTAASSNALVQTFRWYDQALLGSLLNVGPTYSSSFASSSDLYVIQAGLSAPTPPQTSLDTTGNTSGYWFVAPNTFVITSLFVPTADSSKFQNIAVLKMDDNINPPTASLTTNNFSVLYKTQVNTASGAISVNIIVNEGDVIGILGSRESENSLSNTNNSTIVNGDIIPLSSFGFPGQLTTTNPFNVSSFPLNPNISRVSFEYTTSNVCINPARTPITAVVNLTFLDTINISVCDSFRVNPSSTLYDFSTTVFDSLQSVNGCDSVIRINLTVNNSSLDSMVISACDSFMAPSGDVYFASSAFYDSTLYASGCNNIKYINLTVNSSYSDSTNITVCDLFTSPLGNVYTNDTTFTELLQSANACDSLVYFDLEVNSSVITSEMIEVCNSYASLSGIVYFTDTTYIDTLSTSLNCDSIVFVSLVINSNTLDSLTEVHCDTYLSPIGDTYMASATFYDTLSTSTGCDSVVYVDLTINNSVTQSLPVVVCGEYVSPAGDTYTSSATFIDTLSTVNGCDSIIQIDLTVNLEYSEIISPVVCDTYVSPLGNTYTSSSVFTEVLSTSQGCDSILQILLIVNEKTIVDLDILACNEYAAPNGNVYTSSVNFSDTLVNSDGCDSILNTNLTIVNSTLELINVEVCDSYVSPAGDVHTSSLVFNDTLSSLNACDSVLQIDLTVNYSVFDTVFPAVCEEFTSANGISYTTSGVFTENYTTASACDSIVTFVIAVDPISLEINKEDEVIESLEFDATYQWLDCNTNTMIIGEIDRVLNTQANGSYAVILDNGECMDTTDCVNVNSIGTGIHWLNNAQLSFYPNPSNDQLFISSTADLDGLTYNIYDLNGRVVLTGLLEGKLSLIHIGILEDGMYLAVIDKLRVPILKLD